MLRVTPRDYVEAARVPKSLTPQQFGLWTIQRLDAGQMIDSMNCAMARYMIGFDDYTLLRRMTMSSLHTPPGEIVMEDSARELRKHLPIWLAACGRVLVTGLGLGCVVRGLLANRDVDRVEVVEVDQTIAAVVGTEFAGNRRVGMYVADALDLDDGFLPGRFDFAWHDIWTDESYGGKSLQMLHLELMGKFMDRCGPQGAWNMPRWMKRLVRQRMRRLQLLEPF